MYALRQKLVAMLETRKKKSNQEGFTLLELLVVVAILAAIAGTATIALKDTDARASAAAHVAMMDELNKGILTYRVLQRNTMPSKFDSLMVSPGAYAAGTAAGTTGPLVTLGFTVDAPAAGFAADAAYMAIPDDVQQIMYDGGIQQLQYVNAAAIPDGVTTANPCANTVAGIEATIKSRTNNVVAGNVFMGPDANGCGTTVDMYDGTGTADAHVGVFWVGGSERLTGQEDTTVTGAAAVAFTGQNLATATGQAYLLTGIGPSSTLFDTNELGGMTTVPVYRHVKPHEYNRFIAVWNVGHFNGAGGITAGAQADLVAIVDGALDTKEEELGEWDGTRNTI